jgi:predicted SnoaL-like aldol condensation-catalyzing enzyme
MSQERNKQIVLDFYKKVIAERNAGLLEQFISPDYIQHSPQLPDGIAGLKAAIAQLATLPPAKPAESPIKLVLADGDFVVLLLELNLNGTKLKIVDVFRLADGMIAEHWDAMQPIQQELLQSPATVIRVFKEHDVTVTQSVADWQGNKYAVYEIAWLAAGKRITVQQKIPETMPHANGMV